MTKTGTDPIFLNATLRLSAGVIIWALHFAAVYGFTALACARGWHGAVLPFILTASLLAASAVGEVIVAGLRRRTEFEGWMSAAVGGFALVAIVYEAIPVLIVPVCG
jgi:hypothetical protein